MAMDQRAAAEGNGRWAVAALLPIVAIIALFACFPPTSASAAGQLKLGMYDNPNFLSSGVSDSEHDFWFDRAKAAGVQIIRIDLVWRVAVVNEDVAPADPTNPADPNYDFSEYDAAIRRAAARGQQVLLTVWGAPRFAEGPNRPAVDCLPTVPPPGCSPAGTWKPDAGKLAQFGTALATRYSGSYVPSGESGALPKVKYYQVWNEPNLSQYLNPQRDDSGNSISAARYRTMLNSFYESVHSVQPTALVAGPGTAPVSAGREPRLYPYRTAPLEFLSDLLCTDYVDGHFVGPCNEKPMLDILTHNAFPARSSDDVSALPDWPDALVPSNFDVGVRLLRTAEEKARVLPDRKGREVWDSELWIGSNPPDPNAVSLADQALQIQTAISLVARAGAAAVLYFKLRDQVPRYSDLCYLSQCGVGLYPNTLDWPFRVDEVQPKPALTAFSFPLVVASSGRSGLSVWLRPPAKGVVNIEQRAKTGWTRVSKVPVKAGVPVVRTIKAKPTATLRARIGARTSLAVTSG